MVKTHQGRSAFTRASLFLFMALVACGIAAAADNPLDHARAFLVRHPLIDGHNDLAWAIRENATAPRDVLAYDLRRHTPGNTDL